MFGGYDAETGKGGVVVDKPEAESNNIEETGSDTTTVGSDGSGSYLNTVFDKTQVGGRFYDQHNYTISEQEDAFLQAMCKDAGVDYRLMVAVIAHESGSKAYLNGGYTGFTCANDDTGWVENLGAYYTGMGSRIATNGKYSYGTTTSSFTSGDFSASDWYAKAQAMGVDLSSFSSPYMSMIGGVSIMKDNIDRYGQYGLQSVLDHYGEGSRYGSGCASTLEIMSYYEQLGGNNSSFATK